MENKLYNKFVSVTIQSHGVGKRVSEDLGI